MPSIYNLQNFSRVQKLVLRGRCVGLPGVAEQLRCQSSAAHCRRQETPAWRGPPWPAVAARPARHRRHIGPGVGRNAQALAVHYIRHKMRKKVKPVR